MDTGNANTVASNCADVFFRGRFGKDYKMYKRLKPTLQLDITNLVEEIPRACDVCESLAEFECRDCYVESNMDVSFWPTCIPLYLEVVKRSILPCWVLE